MTVALMKSKNVVCSGTNDPVQYITFYISRLTLLKGNKSNKISLHISVVVHTLLSLGHISIHLSFFHTCLCQSEDKYSTPVSTLPLQSSLQLLLY